MNQLALINAAVQSTDPFPVNFDNLWKWVGFSRKDNAKRVLDANFTIGVDFSLLISEERNKPQKITLTLDAAKAFAMLAQTDVGKQVRTAFIEVEKEYRKSRTMEPIILPRSFSEALRLLAAEVEAKEALVLENATMKPKADFFDAVTASDDTLDWNRAAKLLGVGRNKLMQLLRSKKVLLANNTPYQEFIDREYFRVVESKWENPKDGTAHVTLTTRVFQTGIEWLRRTMLPLMDVGK